jgi:hypothetical protein
MADQNEIVASLVLDSKGATESVKSFKAQLREATTELLNIREKFGELSPEALNASKRVAELRDNIKDASEITNLFDPGAKFQVLGNVVKTVTGGFSALTGTMALLGAESDDVAKTLVKVQAALAISEGVSAIADSAKDFERLNALIKQSIVFQKLNEAATKAATFTQKLFGISVDTTSNSFKLLKGAIIATGIGLAIVAIGEIVSITQQWTSATEKQIEAQKELKEQTVKLADVGLKAEQDFINRQEKLDIARAKARGATDAEIFKLQEASQKSRINSQARHYEEVSKVDEVGAEDSKRIYKNQIADLTLLQLNYEAEQRKKAEEAEKKRQEKARSDAEKRKQELLAALERERAAQADLRKLREDNYLLEEKDTIQAGRSKIIIDAENEKERIKQLKISEGLKLQLLEELRRKERDLLNAYDEQVAEEQKVKDEEKLKNGLQLILDQAKVIQEQTEMQNELRAEVEDEKKDEFEIQLEELNAQYKKRLAIVGSNEALYNEIVESNERQRSAIVFMQGQQRLQIVSGILGKAAELFGKQTAAGKVLAIAEATINTYAGATAALRSKVPFPEPVATGIRIAQAALIVATGLKSIREIAKAKVPGSSGGDVSVASASAPIVSTPTIQTTQIDQESINNLGDASKTQRAYVIEGDITDEQEKVTRLNRAAVLGG